MTESTGFPFPSRLRKTGFVGAASALIAFLLLSAPVMLRHGAPEQQAVSPDVLKNKAPAVTHPKFVHVKDASFLREGDRVIGVVVNGIPKAYPIRILNWHEAVDDVTAGKAIAVTYCPLTGSAAVYDRTVEGKTISLAASGEHYQSNTLLSDSGTHSRWSQLDGHAVSGAMRGKQLTALPSIVTPWGVWRRFHTDTLVLSTNTGYTRHYDADPYSRYAGTDAVLFPVSNSDQRLRRKELVLGLDMDHKAEAFSFMRLAGVKSPLATRVGGRQVEIFFDPASATAGAVESGKHIPAYTGYWFAWAAFHPQTAVWEKPKPVQLPIIFKETGMLNRAREGQTATLLKTGKVLIAGGDNGVIPMVASAELYDPAKRTFTMTGSMNHPRGGHTATLLADGRVLVAGGIDDQGTLGSAELYDPATGTFKKTGAMSQLRQKHTATLLKNGQVLIAGGYTSAGDALASAELYAPDKGAFTAVGPMSVSRQSHTATLLHDGRVLIAGGTGPNGRLQTAELYDPSTRRFTATGSLSAGRQAHSATLLKNGTVLIAGGIDSAGALGSTELYDPATRRFSPGGDLVVARQGHKAVLLSDGRILFVGGAGIDSQHRYLASVELYDPASRTSSLLGEMLLARFGPTLTLLDDGEVLVTGRFAAPDYYATATAEVYQPPVKATQ